ncbi:MAG: TonB-dependent receptor, partial [Candidatus Latescibacterota bacterium]
MKTSIALALVLNAFLYVAPALGQEITGNIEGRILDETGEPIPFVTITVSSPSLQGTRSVMSTSDGYFGVFKLPVGTYSVAFAHVSFQEVRHEDVMVRLGRTTTMGEIKLSYRVYEVPEVVVTEKKPLLDVTTTTVGANLVREDFEVLPIARDYRNIPALLPQVDENFFGDGINFVGGTGFENRYFVDGVDVTDPYQSRTGIDLPYNFMREVEVRTGSYEAEYRSSLGGVVNVITNSGGNEFHGQVFGFFTSDRFTQDPKQGVYEPPATEFSEYDLGFSLGGPVSRDKLWFFAAYNPTVEQRDVETPGFGFQKDENIAHVFSGKLTWKAAEKINVAFSVFGDPGFRDAVAEVGPGDSLANLDPVLREQRSGGTALSLYGNYLMNDRTLFEVTVSRNDRVHRNEPATERGRSDSLFIDEVNGIWSGGSAGTFEQSSSRTSIETKGTVILGNHKFKTGLEYREISTDA